MNVIFVEESENIEYEPLPMTPTNNEQKGAAVTTELEVVYIPAHL